MLIEYQPATMDLFRQLERRSTGSLIVSIYAPKGCNPDTLWIEVAKAVQIHGPHSRLLQAVVDHVATSMLAVTAPRSHKAHAYACFADVGGSVQDDTWIELGVHVPVQAYIGSMAALLPLVAALERMQPLEVLDEVDGLTVEGLTVGASYVR